MKGIADLRSALTTLLLAALPAPALAGIDDWVRLCRQDNSPAYCEQQGRRLAAASHAEAAASFNINSVFARLFNIEYGTAMPGTRLRPGQSMGRAAATLDPMTVAQVSTVEGLHEYLAVRRGKGNPHIDFLYAGSSKGAERVAALQQAATAGNADAMYVLGYIYANALDGVQRDDAQAGQWFAKAATAGNAAAMGVQARFLAARATDGSPEAVRLAGKGCDLGAQSACIVLGDLLLAGKDAEQDIPKALQLYGNVLLRDSKGFSLEPERQMALYALARVYVDGRYIPANKVEARDDLTRALNVDGGMLTDAWLTYAEEIIAGPDGEYGFARDAQKGLDILRRFADMGDASATLSLGTLLLGGRDGVPADPVTGRAFLKRAAGDGDTLAMTALAQHYVADNNVAEAFRWSGAAAQAGDPHAWFLQAMFHLKGKGTTVDESAFRTELRKSCELGYSRACVEMGNRMLQGANGFPQDAGGAMALLERARRDGSADASWALGSLKISTEYGNEEGLLESVRLLLEASRRGSAQADAFLARIAAGDNADLKSALARAREMAPEKPVTEITPR